MRQPRLFCVKVSTCDGDGLHLYVPARDTWQAKDKAARRFRKMTGIAAYNVEIVKRQRISMSWKNAKMRRYDKDCFHLLKYGKDYHVFDGDKYLGIWVLMRTMGDNAPLLSNAYDQTRRLDDNTILIGPINAPRLRDYPALAELIERECKTMTYSCPAQLYPDYREYRNIDHAREDLGCNFCQSEACEGPKEVAR